MATTVVRGGQIQDSTIQRVDLDTSTVGQAVIAKVVQGTGISISSTGGDSGTGDVTINRAVADGLPTGGNANDILRKNSATNYHAGWLPGPGFNYVTKALGAGTSNNASGLMMGAGVAPGALRLTAARSGLALVGVMGSWTNNTAGAAATFQFRYGTGTAPAYQSAGVGTAIGANVNFHVPTGTYQASMSACFIVALSVGTDYWFDLALMASSGTTTINSPALFVVEL